jgi:prevent-host-death family protein
MQELAISVTQAARRFADCINRVHYQGASFVLHKNGVPVARIVPVDSASREFERLAVALREARQELTPDQDPIKQTKELPKRPALNW